MAKDNEKPVPPILWKFRQWNDHTKGMIEKGEVFFAPKEILNDPLDLHWRELLPETGKERRDFAKKLAKQQFSKVTSRRRKDLANYWAAELENAYITSTGGLKDTAVIVTSGVLSCSEVNDDFLMWSHYSGGHRGICVGLLPDKIDTPFRSCIYQKEPPTLDFRAYVTNSAKEFVRLARTKSHRWKYEKEWRALHERAKPTCYLGCVDSVVFGLQVTDAIRDEVRAAIKTSGQPIKLFQVEKVPTLYELRVVSRTE